MVAPLHQVLLIMPALNEQDTVGAVIGEAFSALPGVNILVVSDGSTDLTASIASASGARVLELPCNLGVGGAMRLGFRYAKIHGFSIAVQLDSDGQHNPADVPLLLEKLGDADVVIGARFDGIGSYAVRGPRRWAMVLLSKVLSAALKTRLTDTTSGFKAHGERAICVFAADYPAEYLGDTIESLVIGHRAGLHYSQVAVKMRERAGGTPSHNPIRSAVYLGRAFIALLIAFLRPSISKAGI